MPGVKDLTLEGRDAYSLRVHFTTGGEDLDVSADAFEAVIHESKDWETTSTALATLTQDLTEAPTGAVVLSLTSTQVDALPDLSFWHLTRLVGGDEDARQTILEGRVRHE